MYLIIEFYDCSRSASLKRWRSAELRSESNPVLCTALVYVILQQDYLFVIVSSALFPGHLVHTINEILSGHLPDTLAYVTYNRR